MSDHRTPLGSEPSFSVASRHPLALELENIATWASGQIDILQLIASHAPARTTLERICQLIEKLVPHTAACVARPDDDGCSDPVAADRMSASVTESLMRACDAEFVRLRLSGDRPRLIVAEDPGSDDDELVIMPFVALSGEPLGALCLHWRRRDVDQQTHEELKQAMRFVQVALEQEASARSFQSLLAAERRSIADDLHDGPVQDLLVVDLILERLAEGADDDVSDSLDVARRHVVDVNEQLRQTLFVLRPDVLDEDGLAAAIRVSLENSLTPLGVAWTVDDRLRTEPDSTTRSLAFRLTHEALSNVARHARASEVTVTLEGDDALSITVSDDGVGFDPSDTDDDGLRHGLSSLTDLVRRISGRVEFDTAPGRGCRVEIWLPSTIWASRDA